MARFLERLAIIVMLMLLALLLLALTSWKLRTPTDNRLVQQQPQQLQQQQQQQQQAEIAATAASKAGDSGVVRIIHQTWSDSNLPPLFNKWFKSFDACMPQFEHRLWTDEDNRKLISDHYSWFLPRYDSYGPGVQKSDVSRLFYMYHYGGVYCDLDCDCIKSFEHLLTNTSLAFGAMQGKMITLPSDPQYVAEGQIENSFMYSKPRHPFFLELIQKLNSTKEGLPIMTSGPYLIMSGIHSTRDRGLDKTLFDGLPYLTVYPPEYFNPFSWITRNSPHCQTFGLFRGDSLQRCRDSFPSSYVVQYHTQVWDKGRRNVIV